MTVVDSHTGHAPLTHPDEDLRHPKSVLGKAQLILEAFRSGPLRMGLTELSQRSGVPKTSVHRLAQELSQWGLLERVGEHYQLGLRVFELGQRVPISAVLATRSRPHLAQLFAVVNAPIHLAVLEGTHVMYVAQVGAPGTPEISDVGRRFPATCTASGKLLLAMKPGAEALVGSLTDADLMRPTTHSVSTVKHLQHQLREIRDRGWAKETHELFAGWTGVAVPVRDRRGRVHAALAVGGPVGSLPARSVPLAMEAARQIGHAIDAWFLESSDDDSDFSTRLSVPLASTA